MNIVKTMPVAQIKHRAENQSKQHGEQNLARKTIQGEEVYGTVDDIIHTVRHIDGRPKVMNKDADKSKSLGLRGRVNVKDRGFDISLLPRLDKGRAAIRYINHASNWSK